MNNLFSISGKVALVTGATHGHGRMIAQGFVENGARTYIASRTADECEEVAHDLSQYGQCIALPGDVSTVEGALELARLFAGQEEKLDILVNNVGLGVGGPFESFPEDAWDKAIDFNMKSPFFVTQALLGSLKKAGSADDPARVINMASVAGLITPPGGHIYGAAKAGLIHLSRFMAGNLAPHHITVNVLAPGISHTRATEALLDARGDEIIKGYPLGRIGTPEDIAGAAIYLSSRAGAWVTATCLSVDGGRAGTAGWQ